MLRRYSTGCRCAASWFYLIVCVSASHVNRYTSACVSYSYDSVTCSSSPILPTPFFRPKLHNSLFSSTVYVVPLKSSTTRIALRTHIRSQPRRGPAGGSLCNRCLLLHTISRFVTCFCFFSDSTYCKCENLCNCFRGLPVYFPLTRLSAGMKVILLHN